MAFRLSTGLRTKLLGTSSLETLLNGGFLDIYSGGQPSSADGVETGALLAGVFTTSGTAGLQFGTSGSAALSKSAPVWSGTCSTGGVAGWFRFYGPLKLTGADTAGTSVRFDGAIGTVTQSTVDLVLTNTTLAVGDPVIIDSAQFTIDETQS
jgi:hypothetical protein